MSGPVVLYCLPHAGAGAAAYHGWQGALGHSVRVEAVRLPGRESRIAQEDPTPDPGAIATRIAAELAGPYAIFGHSLGGLLGFQVVRELRRLGAPMPLRLFVSAARSPGLPPDPPFSPMPDEEFLAAVTALGGMPPEVAAHPELLELLLPIMRADMVWLDRYQPADEAPLPVPIVGLCGDKDPLVDADRMAGWAAHSDRGYSHYLFPGGHFFYLDGQLGEVAALIRRSLGDELAPPPGQGGSSRSERLA
jgi:surfactin synthase thioesterase subunit